MVEEITLFPYFPIFKVREKRSKFPEKSNYKWGSGLHRMMNSEVFWTVKGEGIIWKREKTFLLYLLSRSKQTTACE